MNPESATESFRPNIELRKQFLNEKQIRCDNFKNTYKEQDGFTTNCNKEKLIADKLDFFEKEFRKEYGNRPLFLNPMNEAGVQKFVCSTIRPTKLAVIDFFDAFQTARLLSNLIKFQELEQPDTFPRHLVSPYNTLKWRSGDSADFAVLLSSILIGSSFDAFVVVGTAIKQLTIKNESDLDCPYVVTEEDLLSETPKTVFQGKKYWLSQPSSEAKEQEAETKEEFVDKEVSKIDGLKESIKGDPDLRAKPEDAVLRDEPEKKGKRFNRYYETEPLKLESLRDKERSAAELLEKKRLEEYNTINDDEPDRIPADKFVGKRVHFWVLVRKSDEHNIEQHYFFDAVTGNMWRVDDPNMPFLSVWQIFNHRNLWINLNTELLPTQINFDTFDNGKDENWEFFFDDKRDLRKDADVKAETLAQSDGFENTTVVRQKPLTSLTERVKKLGSFLDKPFYWVPKLELDPEAFKNNKNGLTSRFFKKVQIDFYHEFSEPDGLLKRITHYDDFKRLLPRETQYFFGNRKDNIFLRRRIHFSHTTIDYYYKNAQLSNAATWPNWKQITVVDGKSRKIEFYPLRFKDGLIERFEIFGEKTIERYQDRDDFLIYQSVRFEAEAEKSDPDAYYFEDSNVGQARIIKMVQKFERKPSLPANQQISKLRIDLLRNRITIDYHLEHDQISPKTDVINREMLISTSQKDRTTQSAGQKNQVMLVYALEKECLAKIKAAEHNCSRELENFKFSIEESLKKKEYSTDLLILPPSWQLQVEQKSEEEEMNADINFNDRIEVVLRRHGWPSKKLDSRQIEEIKSEIKAEFQNRLLDRASIISQRLQEHQIELDKKKKAFTKKSGEGQAKEGEVNLEKELQDMNLLLDVLNKRLKDFKENAYQQYLELPRILDTDTRLIPTA